MRPRLTRLVVAPVLIAMGVFVAAGCGGSPSSATSGTTPTATAASAVAEAIVALNDPTSGLSTVWAQSAGGGGTAADLAAPSVILAPGYTCELVVTDTGVSLFLQEPGDRLPKEVDWTPGGGVVSQPSVPASAPTGGIPCTLSDSWLVALK